jgi:YggT family protein
MFFLGNFIRAAASTLSTIIWALEIIIILRVILSWADADPNNSFARIICTITDPFLKPFRRFLPPRWFRGLDLSPFFVILALEFIKGFLVRSLFNIADKLGG